MYNCALMQNNNNTCTCMNISNGSKSKRKFMTTEEALEALFHNDNTNFNSDSFSQVMHERASGMYIKSDYY